MTRTTGVRRHAPRQVFKDRREAGQVLAGLLLSYRGRPDVIVLGLARGGLPVAYEVARSLGAPLDAFIVRKLGAPGHEEFAFGALASGGRVVVNDDVLRGLQINPHQLREIAAREGRELRRGNDAASRSGRCDSREIKRPSRRSSRPPSPPAREPDARHDCGGDPHQNQ